MAEGKIRIKDIAKIAGVSATTVSNVIHGRTEKVSRKTRKRIEEILDEQEYAPSMGARILSGKSSGMIAVVVGKRQEWEQESEKLEEILREIEKSLDEREYYMLLHFVKTAEEFVRYAAVWKLDGVICIWLNEEACTRIRQMCAVPVAAIYRTDRIYGKAGEEVARFLFKREKQRIWFPDGTEEYGKVVWQGMQKIFSKTLPMPDNLSYLPVLLQNAWQASEFQYPLPALADRKPQSVQGSVHPAYRNGLPAPDMEYLSFYKAASPPLLPHCQKDTAGWQKSLR